MTTQLPQANDLRKSLARDSLSWFMRYFGEEPDEWQRLFLNPLLESLGQGQGRRILLHAPPQVGKSLPTSRRFPAWHLGRNPLAKIVGSAYSVQFARDSFGESVKNLMSSALYRDVFPESWLGGIESAESFTTPARAARNDGDVSYLSVGSRTGFTGRGLASGDVFIMDDPYASPEEARSLADNNRVHRFACNVRDRVRDGADMVVMYHRYHTDDVAARLEAETESNWEIYRCAAICDGGADDPTFIGNGGWRAIGDTLTPRLSAQKCKEVAERDPHRWASLYQGKPEPESGGLIKPESFVRLEKPPDLVSYGRCWDLATGVKQSNDATASAFGGIEPGGRLGIFEVEQFRLDWPDARARIVATADADLAWCNKRDADLTYGVEGFAAHQGLIADLKKLEPFRSGKVKLVRLMPKGDKRQKASRWAANAAFGLVAYAVTGPRGQWDTNSFFSECRSFSGDDTGFDDQVDAVSLLNHLLTNKHGQYKEEPTNPIWARVQRDIEEYS